jgi:uncharacterized protein
VIVVDSSGLFSALDTDQPDHDRCRRGLEADAGPFILSPFVLGELDYFLGTRVGLPAETRLLRDVARGVYLLEHLSESDIDLATDVIDRYADLNIGLADASIVVLAARAGTRRILTLDERHFRTIQPLSGGSFELIPADAS